MNSTLSLKYIPFAHAGKSYTDEPQPLAPIVYEATKSAYLSALEHNTDIEAIYQIGEVSAPGFSDLDFWIVTRDRLDEKSSERFRIDRNLSAFSRNVVMHQPFLVPGSLMSNFRYIYPAFDLQLLKGSPFPVTEPDGSTRKHISACILADVILECYPREFLRMLATPTIPVRTSMGRLNALKHAIRLFADAGGTVPSHWHGFIENVQTLRTSWFDTGPEHYEQLLSIMESAFRISMELIEKTADLLEALNQEHAGETISQAAAVSGFYTGGSGISFVKHWERNKATADMLHATHKTGCFSTILPGIFGAILQAYSLGNGKRSHYVRRHLNLDAPAMGSLINAPLLSVVSARGRLLDEHLEYVTANNLWFGYFNTLGYYPPVRVKDKLIGLRLEFRSRLLKKRLARAAE